MDVLLIVTGVFAAIYILTALIVTIYMLRPIRRSPEELSIEELVLKQVDPKLYDIPYEVIWLTSNKGYKLFGRFYKVEGSHKYVVLLHGHNAASSGVVRFMKIFRDRGYNTILPDHRYSAKSGGRSITYGHQEKLDVIKFIDYIRETDKDAEIGIMGESMGGATALLVSGMREDLKFCIDYCGYSELNSLLKQAIKRMFLPAVILYPLIMLFFRLFNGFAIKSVSPKESAKNIKYPVLVMHSMTDTAVPYSHHQAILDNLKDCEHICFKDAQHGLSLNTYPEEFVNGVNKFLDRIKF